MQLASEVELKTILAVVEVIHLGVGIIGVSAFFFLGSRLTRSPCCVCVYPLSTFPLTDFLQIFYGCNATGGCSNFIFHNSLQLVLKI
jgi:hypothetical protein